MTAEIISKGRDLYRALAAGDSDALGDLLTDDFRGELTKGLPLGFGRIYDGRRAMMGEAWGAVGAVFEMSPQVEALFDGGDVLIGRGFYTGTAKPTGKAVRAAFAHFWGFDGARFTGVTQVTDSGSWRDALDS